jgi:hypothetical protein
MSNAIGAAMAIACCLVLVSTLEALQIGAAEWSVILLLGRHVGIG